MGWPKHRNAAPFSGLKRVIRGEQPVVGDQMSDLEIITSDLYFAAYLKTVGLPFKTERQQPSNKVHFIFDASDEDAGELKAEVVQQHGPGHGSRVRDERQVAQGALHGPGLMARIRITCRPGFNSRREPGESGPWCSFPGCREEATSNPPPRCDRHPDWTPGLHTDSPIINEVIPDISDCTVVVILDDGHEEELHGITGITWQVHGNEPVSYTLEGFGAGLEFEAPYDGPRPTSWERVNGDGNE